MFDAMILNPVSDFDARGAKISQSARLNRRWIITDFEEWCSTMRNTDGEVFAINPASTGLRFCNLTTCDRDELRENASDFLLP